MNQVVRNLHTMALLCLNFAVTGYSQASPQVKPPTLINKPAAPANDSALARALATKSGHCRVSVLVDTTGMPKSPQTLACTDSVFESNSLGWALNYRFNPATLDGKPVETHYYLDFFFGVRPMSVQEVPVKVHADFVLQPDGATAGPDDKGVYPLTNRFEAPNSPPKMTHFGNRGFGWATFGFPSGTSCEAEMVIDAKGKGSDVSIKNCDHGDRYLYRSASDSLLNSRYEPAILNGKAVPVRASVRLVYDGKNP